MKVLVCPGDDGGCSWYRAYAPYWKLCSPEVSEHLVSFTYSPDDENFEKADVLVIPRIHTELALDIFKKFKASGRPVIMDFDDYFHGIPWYNPALQVFHPGSPDLARFEEALEIATIVTCSTQTLADAYKHRRDDIMVCPNFITNEHFDAMTDGREITGAPKREGQIRIGYAGSHTHFGDVALLAEPLTKIVEAYQMPRVQFVFFGYPPILPLQHRIRCEYYPGTARVASETVSDFMLRYYRELVAMDLDIALAPLVDSEFNRCKSNIKLLEYGIAGVPTVASYVGPYASYDGAHNIAWCEDSGEWIKKLSALIEDATLRQAIAKGNVGWIGSKHTARQAVQAWKAVIERAATCRV